MEVFKRVLKEQRGGIGIAVLAGVLCVAACLHTAAYWMRQEAEETSVRLLRRQLQFAVQALAKADFKEAAQIKDVELPVMKLYPGGYDLKASVKAEQNESGINRYIIAAGAGGQSLALQQLQIALPAEIAALGKSYTLAAGKKLSGAEQLGEIACAEGLGDILQPLDIKSYAAFKELAFPEKSSFEEIGLSGALYYDDGNYSKSIASASKTIGGEGCLVAKMSIFIADGTKLPDFCVIISDGQIEIGKNAVLGRALLLSKYSITVKSGASVKGIALCDGNLTIEEGAAFERDESVLLPFTTALRLKQQ